MVATGAARAMEAMGAVKAMGAMGAVKVMEVMEVVRALEVAGVMVVARALGIVLARVTRATEVATKQNKYPWNMSQRKTRSLQQKTPRVFPDSSEVARFGI